MDFLKRSWAEINLDKALYNLDMIRQFSKNRGIICIVKADAYGHGADRLCQLYQENQVESFAVSNIAEAIKLRKSGITADILVLGYTPADCISTLVEYNISQTVYCSEYATALSEAATEIDAEIKIHIKIDTGMARLGFNCRNYSQIENTCDTISHICFAPGLIPSGIFSHFSSADNQNHDDIQYTSMQSDLFEKAVSLLSQKGINFKYIHCYNSAAILLSEHFVGNYVRPGIILYGISPSNKYLPNFTQKPILSLKSSVSMVKEIDPGTAVGYGRTFISDRKMKIATVSIGYADGYPREYGKNGKVIINGKFAPIVGRICMDQLTVDITGIDNVVIGTTVTIIGEDGNLKISVEDIAASVGTIGYEVICNISNRVPRVYIKDGKIEDVVYLGGLK